MKRIAAICVALSVLCISSGTAYAYFTARQSRINEVSAARNDIEIVEEFTPPGELKPGQKITKKVAIKSTSGTTCYVRVRAHFSDAAAAAFCEPLIAGNGWTLGEDGYYYWEKQLQPGEMTGQLFDSVTIKSSIREEELRDFDLLIYAESVACDGLDGRDAWAAMDGPAAD